ncbi:hypothetical protein BHE74_00030121 [Ensete ventricosum]|nr:hypothetical protein BHE74_00030121 [Ensete ventricosum]RZS16685.1 hypothetical protein BHM03_00048718 [Ensete ventricosum]
MHAAVEGTREIGWLKGWWTEGFSFLVRFVVVLGAKVEARVTAIIGIAWEGGGMDDGYKGSKITALYQMIEPQKELYRF